MSDCKDYSWSIPFKETRKIVLEFLNSKMIINAKNIKAYSYRVYRTNPSLNPDFENHCYNISKGPDCKAKNRAIDVLDFLVQYKTKQKEKAINYDSISREKIL